MKCMVLLQKYKKSIEITDSYIAILLIIFFFLNIPILLSVNDMLNDKTVEPLMGYDKFNRKAIENQLMIPSIFFVSSIYILSAIFLPIEFYERRKKSKRLTVLMEYQELLEFIDKNSEFPQVDYKKIENYDFNKQYHEIQLFLLEKNVTKLIELLDIWDRRTIIFNNKTYMIPESEYENMDKLHKIIKDIKSLFETYPNVRYIEFIPKNSTEITLIDLNDYYVKVAKNAIPY